MSFSTELKPFFSRLIGTNPRPVYGNDPSLFSKWKEKTTERTLASLEHTKSLSSLLQLLGRERQEIAIQTKTIQAEKFGLLRTEKLPDETATLTHLLDDRYSEINQKLMAYFHDFVIPIFSQPVDVAQCIFQTESTRYTIDKFDPRKIGYLAYQILNANPRTQEDCDRINSTSDLLNCIGGTADMVNKGLRLPNIAMPQSPDIGPLTIGPLQFLVATTEVKVNGKWRLATRHIVWLNQPEPGPIKKKTIDYFRRFGFATLVHSPRHELKDSLESLEPLTQKLLQPYKDRAEFQKDLATWEYRLFNAMPYYRGSASIIEIMREALCRKHKEKTPNRKDTDAMFIPFIEAYLRDSAAGR
jgi:hypothetical protein